MTLDAAGFTRRYLLHVLPRGFVKIRHFGFLANRNRRQALRLCRSLLPAAPDPGSTPLTDLRCRAVERKCPRCQIGRLRIIDRIPAQQLIHIGVNVRLDTS